MDLEERDAAVKEIVAALTSGGVFGDPPEWYAVLRYAEKLNIPPWDVEAAVQDHPEWFYRVQTVVKAENEAKVEARMRSRRKWTPDINVEPDTAGVPIPRVDAVSKTKVGE